MKAAILGIVLSLLASCGAPKKNGGIVTTPSQPCECPEPEGDGE